MSVLVIIERKCTLAASHAAPMVSRVEYASRALLRLQKRRDRRTDARPLHYAYR